MNERCECGPEEQRSIAGPLSVWSGWLRNAGFDTPAFGWVDGGASAYVPRIDVVEENNEVRVTAELPGLNEQDIDVALEGDVLTIRGEKKTEHEEKNKQCYRLERSYGAFHRAIALPAAVDDSKVAASFKRGVLTVTLPKAVVAQPQAKKIVVKSESSS